MNEIALTEAVISEPRHGFLRLLDLLDDYDDWYQNELFDWTHKRHNIVLGVRVDDVLLKQPVYMDLGRQRGKALYKKIKHLEEYHLNRAL